MSRELGGEIARDGDFQVFESCHFRNGFMYKNFVMAAIVSTCSPSRVHLVIKMVISIRTCTWLDYVCTCSTIKKLHSIPRGNNRG